MYQPCKTCPFRENPVEPGALDWLNEIMDGLMKGKSMDHSCHMTDPKADFFAGTRKKRRCVGFLGMVKAQTGDCISLEALHEIGTGRLDWTKIPTKGVFRTYKDFVTFHLRKNDIEFPGVREIEKVEK